MTRIAVIVGSTRPRRRAPLVAGWVAEVASTHLPSNADTTIEVVDLLDHRLPLLDEPAPAAIGDYANAHTRAWAQTIASYDGFIFVTPEYNHSMPAALKNAIDYLFAEWNDKAAGFVSYGLHGGTRAVEHLRLALAEVKIACVRTQVALSLFTDFDITDMAQPGTLAPAQHHEPALTRMLDEVVRWSQALAPLRPPASDLTPAQ
jgi:NAD(P)H-dependent FMN reductase